MDSKKVLEYALALGPDASLDVIWGEEAERRLVAHRDGILKTIPMDEVFSEDQ